MHENKRKNDNVSAPRRASTRTLAYLLIGIGVLWLTFGLFASPFDGGFDNIGEWAGNLGQSMGHMGEEIGRWGAEFGQAMGDMDSDFGHTMGRMGSALGRFAPTLFAFGLIGLGLLLTFRRKPQTTIDETEKPKRHDAENL